MVEYARNWPSANTENPSRLAGRVADCIRPPFRGHVPRDVKPPLHPPFRKGRSLLPREFESFDIAHAAINRPRVLLK